MVPFMISIGAPSWLDVAGQVEIIVDGVTAGMQTLTPDVVTVGKHWTATANVGSLSRKKLRP